MIDTIGLLTDVESMLVFTFKLKHKLPKFFLNNLNFFMIQRFYIQVTYVIDYYDGGDVNEDFTFSLLDVRPKMTNWCEIRKDTDWSNWQNWANFRIHTEAVIDRARVRKILICFLLSTEISDIDRCLGCRFRKKFGLGYYADF